MNRVGDTTPQEMPNISMRLQTKLRRNTLKVTIVSVWSDQQNMTKMNVVVTLWVLLAMYQTISLIMNGSD
jgi:hypothetical protein